MLQRNAWVLLVPHLGLLVRGLHVHVYFDSQNHGHRDIGYHPEQPERITTCVKAIADLRKTHAAHRIRLVDVSSTVGELSLSNTTTTREQLDACHAPASPDEMEHARSLLMQTHNPELVTALERKTKACKERRKAEGREQLGHMGYVDPDTFLTTESLAVCLRATVAWIRAVDCQDDDDSQQSVGFALTRPPGHHATYDRQNGFCLFNFAAAAAMHCCHKYNQRVAILDWDVHYGQGVADIVTRGENVGKLREKFDLALEYLKGWQPDVVLVCAGYDALASDELASVSLVASDYKKMTRKLLDLFPNARVAFGLEGGYQLANVGPSGNLADAVVNTISACLDVSEVSR